MKKFISIILIVALALSSVGCASMSTGTQKADNSIIGGILGAATGALVGGGNKWKTGAIGAAVGAAAGYVITAIAESSAQEAIKTGKPVAYKNDNGNNAIVEPVQIAANEQTRCRKVREREYNGDTLVKDTVREVCDGAKTEGRYSSLGVLLVAAACQAGRI